jgi:hypothetical protein
VYVCAGAISLVSQPCPATVNVQCADSSGLLKYTDISVTVVQGINLTASHSAPPAALRAFVTSPLGSRLNKLEVGGQHSGGA